MASYDRTNTIHSELCLGALGCKIEKSGAFLILGCRWVQMGANGCISESFVVFYPHAACVYS